MRLYSRTCYEAASRHLPLFGLSEKSWTALIFRISGTVESRLHHQDNGRGYACISTGCPATFHQAEPYATHILTARTAVLGPNSMDQ